MAIQRLAKLLARAGVAPSRRAAEDLMRAGAVHVNDTPVPPHFQITQAAADSVRVLEHDIPKAVLFPSALAPQKLWLADKLAGELVTLDDPLDRPILQDRLDQMGLPRPLISVGRLDFNTEGLLLLTSCGHLARELEHPRNSIRRVYHVLVHGNLTHKTVTALRRGITVDGEKFRPMEVSVLDQSSERKWWLEVTLREGKYREVRRLLSVFGLTVNRLVRHAYGPYTRIPHRGGVMRVKLKGQVLKLANQVRREQQQQQEGDAGG